MEKQSSWYQTVDGRNLYGDLLATPTIFSMPTVDGSSIQYRLASKVLGNNSVPRLTWTDGSRPTSPYSNRSINRCGETSAIDAVSPETFRELVLIGTTDDGDSVYGYDEAHRKSVYERMYSKYAPESPSGNNFAPYEKYTKVPPVFFIFNELGQLVRFVTAEYLEDCYYG
ncbi:MAG: hypothetical protein K2X03_23505 [Bryobacteraceae bacterium]|nr:hypothetical protein [Bryobacteraceae bacterium]